MFKHTRDPQQNVEENLIMLRFLSFAPQQTWTTFEHHCHILAARFYISHAVLLFVSEELRVTLVQWSLFKMSSTQLLTLQLQGNSVEMG